jgi:methylenetetrahydrofolate dehydrogenase (NADP+)/methenyltetrahydrofolate cyclohydrolase
MGEILKGKPVADSITEDIKTKVERLKNSGLNPKLAILRVGNDPSDLSYERGALARMAKCGIDVEVLELSDDVTEDSLIAHLEYVSDRQDINGILIFRPLPGHLDEDRIKNFISPAKDVDCLSPANVAKIMEGDKTGFSPATPSAVMEILKFYKIDLSGKHCVVLGRSMVVGKPVSMLLLGQNATVTICHSKTKDLKNICKMADVLIAAVGRAKMVDESFIKEGAIVIDVGINMDDEGNLIGDVDFESCINKTSMITPVPGGVGGVTTSVLAQNVLKACEDSLLFPGH